MGVILYGAYDLLVPDPTCSDGIQNQGEEGIDCGSVCGVLCGAPLEALIVGEPEKFDAGDDLDVLVEIKNPNTIFGAARVDWRLVVLDGTGQEVTSRRGFTYANPLETRFLIVTFPGLEAQGAGVQFEYEPAEVRWFGGRLPKTQVVDFSVLNEQFVTDEDGSVSYTADIRNDSTFDFDEVDVSVILLDVSGRRLGIGATIIRTLVAGQIRAVTVQWPFNIAGTPVRTQVEVSTNVFNNDNFIRTYGGQERFQGF